jgi:hypothetical protein
MKKIFAAFALSGAVIALPATDNFSGLSSGGNITEDAQWTLVAGDVGFNRHVATEDIYAAGNSPDGVSMAYWDDDVFGNDQYSQIVITDDTGVGSIGACVRLAAGADGYCCRADGYITRYDDASVFSGETVLVSGLTTAGTGDTLRCEANGTTITRKIDGATEGSTTDATYVSGSAGIWGYANSMRIDDFEGGNLGGAAPSFVPAIVNAPVRGGGILAALFLRPVKERHVSSR